MLGFFVFVWLVWLFLRATYVRVAGHRQHWLNLTVTASAGLVVLCAITITLERTDLLGWVLPGYAFNMFVIRHARRRSEAGAAAVLVARAVGGEMGGMLADSAIKHAGKRRTPAKSDPEPQGPIVGAFPSGGMKLDPNRRPRNRG